jgi:ABC-type methionine transport system permease subunit
MGKYLFYGSGGIGTAVFLFGCVKHNSVLTSIGIILLILCVIISLFSKEK